MDDWENPIEGQGDIDILEIKTYKSDDNCYLFVELKVAGKIKNSQDVEYEIELKNELVIYSIEDEGCYSYNLYYYDGFCSGNIENDDRTDFLETSIKNSDTLIIKVPLERLAEFLEFGLWCHASKKYDGDHYYSDTCPEDWGWYVQIIEPSAGSTVFKNCSIKGVSDTEDGTLFKSVEVKIDSLSSSGWAPAYSSDNWTNWIYNWNTEEVSDGEYKIYARAYMGGNYYYDKITLYVDQATAINPRIAELPTYHVGDRYKWKSTETLRELYEMDTWKYELIGQDTITINGTNYNTYVFTNELQHEDSELSYYYKSTFNRTYWLRCSDLALIKDQIRIENIETEGEQETVESGTYVTTYEYPKGYNWFPLEVGNRWEIVVIEKGSHKGYLGNNTMNNYSNLFVETFECLRTENISVPAGTFEVFVIRYEQSRVGGRENETNMPNIENESQWELYGGHDGLAYYSPEIGQFVKTNGYSGNNLFFEWGELVSYKYGNKSFEYEYKDNTFNKFGQGFTELIFSLIFTNAILITTLFITITEVGKISFFNAIAPFFTKHKKKRNYEHGFIKGSVRGVIYANPGENYSSIKKTLELPNGTLTYYLKALEKEGMIRSERDGFLKRFYPTKGMLSAEVFELTDIQKDIHEIIKKNPGIYQKDIQSKLDISQQRLNYHIKLMVDARILKP